MGKKSISAILMCFLWLTMLLAGCAGPQEVPFDLGSFMEDDFFAVDYDEMMAQASIQPAAVAEGVYDIHYDDNHTIGFQPFVSVDGPSSVCGITVTHTTRSGWWNPNELIVKIDGKNYVFSKFKVIQDVDLDTSTYTETFTVLIDNQALPLIERFVEHKDDTIRVYITTEWDTFDFVLPEEVKAGVAKTFEQFDAAGGTSKANMRTITNAVKKDKLQKCRIKNAD